jgi:hypothetical protein
VKSESKSDVLAVATPTLVPTGLPVVMNCWLMVHEDNDNKTMLPILKEIFFIE